MAPARYRDILPQPLPSLIPVEEVTLPRDSIQTSSSSSPSPSPDPAPSLHSSTFRTPRNLFGLSRLYHSKSPPLHDPEDLIELQDLAEGINRPSVVPLQANEEADGGDILHPYPNKNSFLLGEWYWNGGAQKSRESFNSLIDIVGDPTFRPEDIRETKWAKLDEKLAQNSFDDDSDAGAEWLDDDAGWKKSLISISVPFHSRTKKPGTQTHEVGYLYHRSIVSVIREKLANHQDMRHFHYQPYELLWRPTDTSDDVRVYGELYTSPAFLEAQRKLQDSPGERGCSLPRVIVAMMLWSDATHLTSFGTAKLWPCYLFFGNESKYRRCKPTCHLCNHVAYFEEVRFSFSSF